MTEPLLQIRDLHVSFAGPRRSVEAVRGFDLDVQSGEVVGVVGESGSGKSVSMLAALGLLGKSATVTGSIRFAGRELLGAPAEHLRVLRGGRIGIVFQDPMTSLNPVLTVGKQVIEAISAHRRGSRRSNENRAIELLEMVSIPNARTRLRSFPHELSGGMRQRVMIAMAMANDPDLLIADEPTTALDVTIQAQILDALSRIQQERQLAIVLITHDLGVVAGIADRVNVMYHGRIVERGPIEDVFYRHEHPYTEGLLRCLPRLDRRLSLQPIGGSPVALDDPPPGCSFEPRCMYAQPECRETAPELRAVDATSVSCHMAPIVGLRIGARDVG